MTRFWTCLGRTALIAALVPLLLSPTACASRAARRVGAQPASAWESTSIARPANPTVSATPAPAVRQDLSGLPAPATPGRGAPVSASVQQVTPTAARQQPRTQPQTQAQPRTPTQAQSGARASDPTSTDTARFLYRFRAGDEVGVEIWQEKDLSGIQRVLRDGTISPPLLEPMHIEGQTIKEVRARLIAHYREYLKEPRVTVRVASVQSDRMFILGEVKTPKAVSIYGPMTLMQGIAEAGGFLEEFANKKTIRIVRQVRGGPSRILTVNAESVLYGRRQDLAMRAGDIVFVHPTGLTNWSRKFSQALDPVAGLLGAAGDAAALAIIAR